MFKFHLAVQNEQMLLRCLYILSDQLPGRPLLEVRFCRSEMDNVHPNARVVYLWDRDVVHRLTGSSLSTHV